MYLTNEQKHSAFHRAADVIESHPELYNFDYECVGNDDCPACMWGHVGRALNMAADDLNTDVAVRTIGTPDTSKLYFYKQIEYDGVCESALVAAAVLRDFADQHFPTT